MFKDKNNKWYNTIWTERDEAFYFTGARDGFIGGILAVVAVVGIGFTIHEVVNEMKDLNKTE